MTTVDLRTHVSCSCGALRGTARMFMPTGKKPGLAWQLEGTFYLNPYRDLFVCVKCGEAATGDGWEKEESNG